MKPFSIFLFCLALLTVYKTTAQTTVKKQDDGSWQLSVDGQPFPVHGATFGMDIKRENIGKHMRDLKFLGVNTIRTWGTGEHTQILLDSAEAYGIKVMMGLWLQHGQPGMEGEGSFNYLSDSAGMKDMYQGAIKKVKKFKNHPAVLCWGVGNEVVLNLGSDPEKKAYAKFLEKVCSKIQKLDPNHPVASVSAWTFSWKWWKQHTPSLDIYGINAYGGGANQIPKQLEKMNIDKPYVITEFGVKGEWDVPEDKNGLKIEPNDQQKYSAIADGYRDWVKPKKPCLGVYVFNYGNADTHGSVWLNMYHEGHYRPQYWATREAFTGKEPVNHVPEIKRFEFKDTASTGDWVPVDLQVNDPDDDKLNIEFRYNQRTGGRARRDQINPLEYRGSLEEGFEFKVPKENGVIKVYAFVKDSYDNLGIAQTSHVIDNGENASDLIPGARTELPFYVYKDGDKFPYSPSGYMGNNQHMKADGQNEEFVKTGKHAFKLSYTHSEGWFGLAFMDPPDDWGDRAGGYNVTGADKFTFWARTSANKVEGKFGFGMIKDNKDFYDTERVSEKFTLSNEWQKYEVDIPEDADLRCIKTGFVMYLGSIGHPYHIWFDNVKFEKAENEQADKDDKASVD